MRVLQQLVMDSHRCEYLPAEVARLEYSYAPSLTAAEYQELMDGGYRKFGALLFRPVCSACQECRPIRVPIAAFERSRSQRRVWRRNADLRVELGPPIVDEQRLDLYARYHAAQAERKSWPATDKDAEEYAFSFVQNPLPAIEITTWEGAALRGVIINDVTPRALSAVYHYHDPEAAERSLGTYLILRTLELARQLRKQYVYLGYFVEGCGSMSYKARFRPCEILQADGTWLRLDP
jgi:arginyl-tRNA--protein-N-Asp/Glu arginylyltransferase